MIKEHDGVVDLGLKVTKTSMGEKYGVSRQTADNSLKSRDGIIHLNEKSRKNAKERTRLSNRNMKVVEDALMRWLVKQRNLSINMGDKAVRGQALAIWTELKPRFLPENIPKPCQFTAGWCTGFKKDRGIGRHVVYGESESVDLKKVEERITEIQRQLVAFELEDIYNCDETGLYVKAMSNKSLGTVSFRDRKIVRSTRVSILFCSNATGTDKRKPLVLSNHRPSRLSENILEEIDIECSDKGYMQAPIFAKWLKALDGAMQQQERRVALLIDSAPCHGEAERLGLTNITLIRLPPNTTSITQPLGAGIIRSFKAHYSQQMLHIVGRIRQRGRSVPAPVPNAKLWPCFASAWSKVTPGCIRKCFSQVPIFGRPQKEDLRKIGVQNVDQQVEATRREVIEKYGYLQDTAISQNDIGVLNYIDMMYSEGPSETMMECVQETISTEEFKDMFIEHTEDDVVDESESEEVADVDEDDDLDFELSGYSASDDDAALVLRSGSAYARGLSHLSPQSNPSTADYTNLKNCSLRSLADQLRQAADSVENGDLDQNRPILNRLLSILRSSEAGVESEESIASDDELDLA